MSNNNIDLNIKIDDSDVKKSLTDIGSGLNKIDKEAKEVEKAFDSAFDPKPIQQTEKAVKDTNKEIDKTKDRLKDTGRESDRTTKSLDSGFRKAGRSVRRFSQGLRGAFARTGIGVFLIALGSIISGFGDFKNKALDALGPVGDFIRGLIDGVRDFLSVITFGIIDSTATVVAELEKQREAILKSQRQISSEIIRIQNETAVKRAKLAGASESELAEIREKGIEDEIESIKAANRETLGELNDLAAERAKLERKLREAREKEKGLTLREELKKEIETIKQQELEKEKILAENNLRRATILEGAADAREAERKAESERIKASAERDAAIAKAAADKAAKLEEDRLKKELELRLLYLVDSETAERIRIQNEADAREAEAEKTIQDQQTLNTIILAIREERDNKLKELDDKLAKEKEDAKLKERNAEFLAAQESLRIQQETAQARLRESEANQKREFNSIEQTENDIKLFEQTIQKEREEQALRFEKERLELLLRFGDLRTDAEKENIKALIAAIDAEINGLSSRVQLPEGEQPEGGFLARLLGATPEQEKAIQEAIGRSIDNVNKLLDTRINALDEEIKAREKNLDRLNNVLSAEQALLEAGEAANVRSTLDQIEQEEKAREEALKKQKQALIAKQTIDAVTQTSSLITASAQIFQSLAPLGPVGIPIAIGTIALMFGSFAAAQVQAFAAIKDQKLNTGGRIMNGEKDTNGGKGNRVEGTNLIVGRGEWVINADASEEHNDFLQALNAGEYDGVNLNKLMSKKTIKSIKSVESKAKKAYNKKIQENRNKALEKALSSQTNILHSDLVGIHNKPQIAATDDGYILRQDLKNGNSITKKVNLK